MGERGIYHETQRLQLCLLHALNNLVQEKDSFTRAELDAIADKLSLDDPEGQRGSLFSFIFRPHHNTLTGNYDVNVLIGALEARGKQVVWHDRRKGLSSIDLIGSDGTLLGIMLNVPVRKLGGLWRSRHWIALRQVAGSWYNLDSDLKAPLRFICKEEVIAFVDRAVSEGAEVFLIMQGRQLERVGMLRSLFGLTCFCFLVLFMLLLLNSKLPDTPSGFYQFEISSGAMTHVRRQVDVHLGKIAETMVSMLPADLAFTIFMPSEEVVTRVLNLTANDLTSNNRNDTMAVLSRVVGFSTIPKHLPSKAILESKGIVYDSISGYRLYVWKDSSGRLIVNDIWSEQSDIWRGKIIIHIISGIIMDAEFELAFLYEPQIT